VTRDQALRWSPRILGILVSLFIGTFALDAFGGTRPFGQELRDFVVHLIPACVLLMVVAAHSDGNGSAVFRSSESRSVMRLSCRTPGPIGFS
jgi:hypothetical protein